MKQSGRIYIVAGIVLAVLAGVLLFLYLSQLANQNANRRPDPTPEPNVGVVVAAQDIAPGTIITGSMISRAERKASEVSIESVREASDALDRMALVEIKAGTPLRRGDIQSVAFVLPKGKRAMALPADDMSTIAGLVREGDYVDVVVSGQVVLNKDSASGGQQPSGQQQLPASQENAGRASIEPVDSQTVVKTVMQGVKVLKVVLPPAPQRNDQSVNPIQAAPDTPPATATAQARLQAEQQAREGRITNTSAIVVLEVTDQEAELLRFIQASGSFQLLLRGRDDTGTEETKGMTLDILIRDYGLPAPKPVLVDQTSE